MNNKKSEILLTLQEGNSNNRRPLFCLHPPLGVTDYFVNLVRHLNPDQPVYGIQSPAFYGIRDPFDNMEDMAKYYLDAIRTIQTEPPYALLGHSSGSYITYEMALQLERHLDNVPILLFIDQFAPIGPVGELMEAFEDPKLTESNAAMFLTAWLVSLAYNCSLTFGPDDIESCASLEEKYDLLTTFFKQAKFIPENADNNMVEIVLKMIANHAAADRKYHEKYTPDGSSIKYEGKTVLFRCTEETVWQGFDATSPPDTSESSNWDKFCSGPIEIVNIPDTDHITMVIEPYVKILAEKLQPYLDEVTLI